MRATSSESTEGIDKIFNFDRLTREPLVKENIIEEIKKFDISVEKSIEKYKKSVAKREIVEYEYVTRKSR